MRFVLPSGGYTHFDQKKKKGYTLIVSEEQSEEKPRLKLMKPIMTYETHHLIYYTKRPTELQSRLKLMCSV